MLMPAENLFKSFFRTYSEWMWYELTVGESFNGFSAHILTKNKNKLFNQAEW
jgi:hypothetical protein